jgi:uncharacterized membrane protein
MNHTSIDFIKHYFTQEKTESIFFVLIGLVAISFALINLCIIKYSFYKGLAYPMLVIGLIQLGVGTTIYIRSPKDIIRVEHIVKMETQKIQTEEIPRMEAVITNFIFYKWIEIVILISGILLFFYCKKSSYVFWKGIGLGLIIQATLMLSLDIIAEKRAKTYLKQLAISCKQL